jgi:hypothetical protein
MRRFMILTAVAITSIALVSSAAQAQYIVQSSPPVIYTQPAPAVYYPQTYVVPSVRYSYYPSAPVVTYSAPQVVTYSAPPVVTYAAPVVTYAAPVATYAAPAGVVTTRSYYGYGIFRPRGYYTESYYTPIR